MYFRALVLSGCVALAGCQSPEIIQQVQTAQAEQVESISALQAVTMKLPSSTIVEITPQSQALKYQNINSHVAMFELPADRGEYSITITSMIEDTAFVPRAIIVDKNGRELESYGSDKFEYTKPRLNLGNRLVAEVDFFPPTHTESVYLIVYTDKSDLGKATMVAHPARLDAEGRGNYLPEVKDIAIPNSEYGKVEVSIDRLGFFKQLGSSSSAETNTKPVMAKSVELVQPETQKYYHRAISAAVESNDLNKAISLLEEAKALNVEGAQEIFVKAVNAKK
ncbi:MalM family protein [Vibrio neptunius]|uniref:Transcriptional regulator n=1 Tax=Vibrio neptunius TaxID=170651 RepID=A0ABS3A290_9VIBR|nr:MalM family protein [Vibrio neptunius]MBN3493815.1 transcriptional regulator [Vibrio neptunius]MBN3516362.1 transcriptional regulator [Vibrio neptunius]MBN3550485.1 transcriptional regulator [Vibrio neptunius]MBN3578616.1 transcriptional regulator [Vibrio neptunius]MCH9872281.1 transcriptional regulator [Vibrio neptunius]